MIKTISTLFHVAKPLGWVLSLFLLLIFHTGMAQSVSSPLGVTQPVPVSDLTTSSYFEEAPRVLLVDGYKRGWKGDYGDYDFSEMPFGMDDFMWELRSDMGPWFLPVFILLCLTALVIGISMILVGSLLVVAFVYILVKIIQSIAAGEGSGTAISPEIEGVVRNEADIIGKYIYYLYLVGFLFPITCIAGVIMSYIHRGRSSEWMKSHYRFLIRTFWIGLLYAVISGVLTIIVIGFVGYALLLAWVIARCVKGIRLHKQGQPIPAPDTWLW